MKAQILTALADIIIGHEGDWLDRHQGWCVAISFGLILVADWVAGT